MKRTTPLFQTAPKTLAELRNKFPDAYDALAPKIFHQRMVDHANIIKIELMQLSEMNNKLLEQHKNQQCYLNLSKNEYENIEKQEHRGSELLSTLENDNIDIKCLEKGYKQILSNHKALYEIYSTNSSSPAISERNKSALQFYKLEQSRKTIGAFQQEKDDLESFENLLNATHDAQIAPQMNI